MRVIGLTGGIACGKSNVSAALRELGAAVIDGDVLSRELTAPGGAALPAIRRTFGDGVLQSDGTLNRRKLGDAVFGHDEARARLDGIMLPMVRELILQRMAEARGQGFALCVLEMPLLYEAGLDALCDRVWCVWLPRQQQLSRLMERDGFTLKEAEARLASQLPTDEKAARSQVVIDTSGSISYTKAMIPALYAEEIRLGSTTPDEGGPDGSIPQPQRFPADNPPR